MNKIKQKSEYCSAFRAGLISKQTNNRLKNRIGKDVRKAKNEYYENCFRDFQTRTKKSWALLKVLTGCLDKQKVQHALDDSDPEELSRKAETFCDFFANIGSILDSRFQTNENDLALNFSNPHSFYFFQVTEQEVGKIVTNLKLVGSHVNSVPVKIFKLISAQILYPLTKLINLSFASAVFPDVLKIARIVPIHKKGDSMNPSNYRPISCLPYIGKIIERCMANRVVSFCEKFKIFTGSQFGFLKARSTCDALINLTEFMHHSLDQKEHNLTILIDLKKAFDTVNYTILL